MNFKAMHAFEQDTGKRDAGGIRFHYVRNLPHFRLPAGERTLSISG